MNLIGGVDSSTCMFAPNETGATIMRDANPLKEHFIKLVCKGSRYGYWMGEPSFCAVVGFDRARLLYTSDLIKYLKLIDSNVNIPPSITKNLERFDRASKHLIKSGEKYWEDLSKEDRLHEEFLEEDFFIEMPPIEEFEIKAKIVFEEGEPDLSGLEDF